MKTGERTPDTGPADGSILTTALAVVSDDLHALAGRFPAAADDLDFVVQIVDHLRHALEADPPPTATVIPFPGNRWQRP